MVKKKTITRGWPESRRQQQAARCRAQKPWEKSTGPKTSDGKHSAACNAYKHGFRSRDMDEICKLLGEQQRSAKNILARFKNQGVKK